MRQSELTEIRPEFAVSHMMYEVSGAGLKTLMMTSPAPRYPECGNNKQCLLVTMENKRNSVSAKLVWQPWT